MDKLNILVIEDDPLAAQAMRRTLVYAGFEVQIASTAAEALEFLRARRPAMILLDEPFSGVDPLAVYDVQEIIKSLKQRGLGILITDHSVRETLSIVDRAYLICEGRVLREGTSDFLINDEVSRELYLGPRFSM